MGVFTNAMDAVFGGSTQRGVPNMAVPNATQQIPANQNPQAQGTTGSTVATVQPNVAPVVKEPAPPMDAFKHLWETPAVDPKKPVPKGMFDGVTQEALRTSAKTRDFRNVIPAETLTKIQAGGAGAMEALLDAMNVMAQTVYADGTHAGVQIIDRAMGETKRSMFADLPSHIRSANSSEQLHKSNPAFKNPALAPMIAGVRSQMEVHYPNATSDEITAMTNEYVTEAFKTMQPAVKATAEKNDGVADWDEWATT